MTDVRVERRLVVSGGGLGKNTWVPNCVRVAGAEEGLDFIRLSTKDMNLRSFIFGNRKDKQDSLKGCSKFLNPLADSFFFSLLRSSSADSSQAVDEVE